MAEVLTSKKACTVNPLKMSQPIGGALAFMGVKGCMPILHGSQGCTSFGLVLFVRHFRESIPLQTTAMSESPGTSESSTCSVMFPWPGGRQA